jgi:hypothetical protein
VADDPMLNRLSVTGPSGQSIAHLTADTPVTDGMVVETPTDLFWVFRANHGWWECQTYRRRRDTANTNNLIKLGAVIRNDA